MCTIVFICCYLRPLGVFILYLWTGEAANLAQRHTVLNPLHAFSYSHVAKTISFKSGTLQKNALGFMAAGVTPIT